MRLQKPSTGAGAPSGKSGISRREVTIGFASFARPGDGAGVRTIRGRIFIGLLLAAVLALPAGIAAPSSASAASTDLGAIFADTNAARAENGLPALSRSSAIDVVAGNWAKKMGAAQSMTHNPDFSTQMPPGWSMAGENVAAGYRSDAVVDAWMKSPGHRANILNAGYTTIGIGYFVDSHSYRWLVQNFGGYRQLAAPTPTVSGTLLVGKRMAASTGAWGPSPVTLAYQWKHAGVAIAGATKSTYTLTTADVGKTIKLTVTGKKEGYVSVSRTSAITRVVGS
jgi:hypothetical protein